MSNRDTDLARIRAHLAALVQSPQGRPPGSAANHAAAEYIAGALAGLGYEVEEQRFDCVDWRLDGVELWMGDGPLPVTVNPYSPPCDATATTVAAGSVAELEAASLAGRIVLLHGALTAMPLFPRYYPFFSIEEHQHIFDLLVAGRPRAIVAVSPMAGRPAPIFEDGDLPIPSVTVSADVGAVLLAAAGAPVGVRVHSSRRPGHGVNVIGRRPYPTRDKIILCAHFDTKPGTPGALDNAAGVAAMLALAGRLAAGGPPTNLEFVAFNGEDHYAAPGEVVYLAGYAGEFGPIALAANLDGLGLRGSNTTIAFFACPDAWAERVRRRLPAHPTVMETEPWPQSDHSLFAMQGAPSIALTSGGAQEAIDRLTHTPDDRLDVVDEVLLAAAVDFLVDVLTQDGRPRNAA
jgi:aminopeptidase YwaD